MRPLLLILLAAIAVSGCLRSTSTILVNKDGTAVITDTVLLTKQTMSMWKEMAKATKTPLETVLREQWNDSSFYARAAELGSGVTTRSVRMITVSGQAGFVSMYDARDITKVRFNKNTFHERMGSGESEGAAGPPIEAAYVTFSRDGDVLTITNPALAPDDASGDTTDSMTESDIGQQVAMVKKIMKDLELSLRIRVASGIAQTDASFATGDVITIIHLPFNAVMNRLEKDPDVFRMMSGMKSPAPYDMEKAFNSLSPAVKMETRPVITVRMK